VRAHVPLLLRELPLKYLLCVTARAGGKTIYATVTSDGARLYALFCLGATDATDAMFRGMRSSLRTLAPAKGSV
jgi:hypothetical protein